MNLFQFYFKSNFLFINTIHVNFLYKFPFMNFLEIFMAVLIGEKKKLKRKTLIRFRNYYRTYVITTEKFKHVLSKKHVLLFASVAYLKGRLYLNICAFSRSKNQYICIFMAVYIFLNLSIAPTYFRLS